MAVCCAFFPGPQCSPKRYVLLVITKSWNVIRNKLPATKKTLNIPVSHVTTDIFSLCKFFAMFSQDLFAITVYIVMPISQFHLSKYYATSNRILYTQWFPAESMYEM